MAAQLGEDKSLDVAKEKGALGELRILVDGEEIVSFNPLLYPSPSSVTRRVKAHLAATAS